MSADFTPTLEGYTGQSKLRYWCQKVLPLVYDDSLSYYELLNKVVLYLNNTIEDVSACEDNIVALRDAFVQLQEYVNDRIDDFAPEVEQIIDDMIDSGEFDEILANVVNGLIANEYSTTQGYAQFDYVLKDGKLYCATASTSGEWDATKWRETTVGADIQLLNQRVYNLNAGQVAFNEGTTYDNNTVGKKLHDLNSSLNDIGSTPIAVNKGGTGATSQINAVENLWLGQMSTSGETIITAGTKHELTLNSGIGLLFIAVGGSNNMWVYGVYTYGSPQTHRWKKIVDSTVEGVTITTAYNKITIDNASGYNMEAIWVNFKYLNATITDTLIS